MKEIKLVDNSKLEQYFQKEFSLIVNESDRGAVLLGLTLLEETLKDNIKRFIPKSFIEDASSNKKEFSLNKSTIDINLKNSLLFRIIPLHLYKSINIIKKLRNKVAHEIFEFKLSNNIDILKESGNLISINENLYSNINELAYNLLYSDLVYGIINLSKTNDLKKFNSYNEVIEYIENNTHLFEEKLDNSLYKTEYAILIFYLYSLINFYFEKALLLVGDNSTLEGITIKNEDK